MGEVYRAHDTKLGRDVAIKILPAAFTSDPDRRARFAREARLLASLNHPHVATVHGVEEASGVQAIVLELVEGPTLADRVARGPVPVKEACAIAGQIADALDAAHEKGIVHRDLKPANIKLTADGQVKVLDFGLAMAVEGPGGDRSALPTQLMSEPGAVVGTAAYMSPEQARGQAVDKRTDIWAFGCVLYEMLTGRRAFDGATSSEMIAKVLEREPDWTALPATTPPAVGRLIERCLEKDSKPRLRDIGDASVDLEGGAGTSVHQIVPKRWPASWLKSGAGLVAVVAIGAGAVIWYSRPAPSKSMPLPVTRFVVTPREPITRVSEGVFAISPDARRFAYVAGHEGFPALYVHDIDQFEDRLIPGTQGADHPSFSPDGAWIAFAADQKIKKVEVAGGEPVVLCDCTVGLGLLWGTDGNILFATGAAKGIARVSAQGGIPTDLTTIRDDELEHDFPDLLPDGKSLLYSASAVDSSRTGGIYVQSLQTGERKFLTLGGFPRYLSSGQLLYAQGSVMFAVPFDVERLAITGPPVIALQGVERRPLGTMDIAISRGGSLVYLPSDHGDDNNAIVWVDRTGADEPLGLPRRLYHQPRLSPDGHRLIVAVTPENSQGANADDLWMVDLDRSNLRRVTTGGGTMPVWAPDGSRVAYTGNRAAKGSSIFARRLDGTDADERLVQGRGPSLPLAWSPDGRFLAWVGVSPDTANDIFMTDTIDRSPARPFAQTMFREGAPTFSPDGRFVAYVSDVSGRSEVYVRPFPGPGQEVQVSVDGGNEPVWARRADELFYRQGDAMMAVTVKTAASLRVDKPQRLFEKAFRRSSALWPNYDVAADGRRFVLLKGGAQLELTRINVVLNWTPPR